MGYTTKFSSLNIIDASPITQLAIQAEVNSSIDSIVSLQVADIFEEGCILQDTKTGTEYKNTGTVAVPLFAAGNTNAITLASAKILVGNSSNVAAAATVSGNATISNTGVVTVTGLTIASQAAGDILYFNGTNWVRLAKGTAGQVLTMNAGATAPGWQTSA